MFINTTKDDSWSVCSGVIDQVAGHEQVSRLSLENIMQHEFVGDTKDGGIALCLADPDGHSIPLFCQESAGATIEMTVDPGRGLSHPSGTIHSVVPEALGAANHIGELSAGCHCGGVTFWVTRPNAASEACSSPYPDLLLPYHSSSSANPADEKWWLRANKSKYLAGTCACRSCRLGSGSPIQTWAFIPRTNLVQSDRKQIDYGMGALKEIESSKGCFRNFCGTCGATVFWHCQERPDLVDVSIGLLRAEEGSRAETWLQWWTGRVSFIEDALDQVLIGNLQRGLPRIKVEG
ncbi:hypothetical protein A1O3_07267 [Capronia epimyces CBS 606.96]|uniref:CENP-V/GFA domain-containing protein n=1 Tax=Capronia epimyces CBS 606.96 TaxID=1182542 RepID=W9YFA4_9EURO|nr:uncharacterized protein A1O3_07267 [Capronia epimyces CBS 606.96]EXJ80979.1 hypothetical protein A1O3_07267 [Capronia epimyces CBS 606.96]